MQEWSSGVDYARLTYTSAERGAWAYEVYRQYIQDLCRFYTGEAPTSGWGFQGYTGEIAGKAASGLRPDGAILQVTSSWADAADMLAMPYTGVPRLDIQVTAWGHASPATVPRKVADASFAASREVEHRPWEVACYDKYGKGDTAYLGSRNSEWFVRVYDKGAESGQEEYAGAIRYEVQLTGRTAAKVYGELAQKWEDPHRKAAVVAGYLAARGVALPEWVSVGSVPRDVVRKEESSTDAKLRWLATQVAPTLGKLMRAGVSYEQLHEVLFHVKHTGEVDRPPEVRYDYDEIRRRTELRP